MCKKTYVKLTYEIMYVMKEASFLHISLIGFCFFGVHGFGWFLKGLWGCAATQTLQKPGFQMKMKRS